MPQLNGGGGDDLGANDEMISFKDEGEQEEKISENSSAERDLADVKSSLVNESETNQNSSSDSEVSLTTAPESQAADGREEKDFLIFNFCPFFFKRSEGSKISSAFRAAVFGNQQQRRRQQQGPAVVTEFCNNTLIFFLKKEKEKKKKLPIRRLRVVSTFFPPPFYLTQSLCFIACPRRKDGLRLDLKLSETKQEKV